MLHLFTGVGFDSKIDAPPCLCYFIFSVGYQKEGFAVSNASVNSSCAHPPPPAGHLSALLVPGVAHLQILRFPEAGHLPGQGPTPSI